jgi:RNA polymerase sigma-70 factor, ECF subfamily
MSTLIGSLVSNRADARLAADDRVDARATTPGAADDTYREFVEAHLDEAYRLAAYVLGRRAEAEDAVHDAAVAAWRGWAGRRHLDRTEAWFRQIVVNVCRDRLRAAARVRAVPMGLGLDDVRHPTSPDVADSVAATLGLEEAVRGLDAEDRILVTLRFGLDLTVPAIAAVLGVREGTVKSRLHRALRLIRSGIAGAGP